jgi:hypothetical protein
MPPPYTFTRRVDGAGNTIYAEHINELQEAIEHLGILMQGTFIAGVTYSSVSTMPGVWSTLASVVANRLYAVPFNTGPEGIEFTDMSIEVTILSAGNARLGVYSAHTTEPYHPNALLLDAGEVSTGTTGIKTINIADTVFTGLAPSRLIWLASVFAATPQVRVIQQTSQLVGVSSTGDFQSGVYMSHTYGALPSTFDNPVDGAIQSVPTIWTVAG